MSSATIVVIKSYTHTDSIYLSVVTPDTHVAGAVPPSSPFPLEYLNGAHPRSIKIRKRVEAYSYKYLKYFMV